MGRIEVSTSVVKCSEGLSNRASIIIRRYRDHMKLLIWLFLSRHSCIFVGSMLYVCIYDCMFFMLLFNFVNYVFLLLCMFLSVYSVSLCCSVCKCVLYCCHRVSTRWQLILILRRSRTGTVWFCTSTSNKRAARPKLYTKSLTRDLKRMYSRLTLVRIFINL